VAALCLGVRRRRRRHRLGWPTGGRSQLARRDTDQPTTTLKVSIRSQPVELFRPMIVAGDENTIDLLITRLICQQQRERRRSYVSKSIVQRP
jgi:hypothetical protein